MPEIVLSSGKWAALSRKSSPFNVHRCIWRCNFKRQQSSFQAYSIFFHYAWHCIQCIRGNLASLSFLGAALYTVISLSQMCFALNFICRRWALKGSIFHVLGDTEINFAYRCAGFAWFCRTVCSSLAIFVFLFWIQLLGRLWIWHGFVLCWFLVSWYEILMWCTGWTNQTTSFISSRLFFCSIARFYL